MAKEARPSDARSKKGSVTSYKVTISKDHIDVTVTSGRLAGKSARLIPMPPAAAYFNVDGKKKRA
jgi:hypothetical protein